MICVHCRKELTPETSEIVEIGDTLFVSCVECKEKK